MAPANTGRDRSSKRAVIPTDQTNRGMLSKVFDEDRIFMMVVMKLMAPKIDDAPARCNLKIVKSTDGPP